MDSQSATSTTLPHFWLLGSEYEHEIGPKTKTNTHEYPEFSLLLTLLYLAIKVSDTNSVTEQIYSPLLRSVSLSLCSLPMAKRLLLLRKQASSMFAT